MVSCLILRSLSRFEFTFVYGVRVCSNFIDSHAAVQLPNTTYIESVAEGSRGINKRENPHCLYVSTNGILLRGNDSNCQRK